jgi:hypothetical protein
MLAGAGVAGLAIGFAADRKSTMECSIFWDAARMFRKTYAMQNPLFGAIRDYLM